MLNNTSLEALNRTARDITEIDAPIGGIDLILAGAFKQQLPVT